MSQCLEELIQEETKRTNFVVIMGEWNAIAGEITEGKEVGAFGLGKNNAGDKDLLTSAKRTNMLSQTHDSNKK